MPLVDKVEAFLPVYERTAGEVSYIFYWNSKALVTSVTFFLTLGTTLVVIESAQILQIKLLKLDPPKMKNKQKPLTFCLL